MAVALNPRSKLSISNTCCRTRCAILDGVRVPGRPFQFLSHQTSVAILAVWAICHRLPFLGSSASQSSLVATLLESGDLVRVQDEPTGEKGRVAVRFLTRDATLKKYEKIQISQREFKNHSSPSGLVDFSFLSHFFPYPPVYRLFHTPL